MKNMIILGFCLVSETITATIPGNPYVTVSGCYPPYGSLTVHMEIVNRTNGQEELLDRNGGVCDAVNIAMNGATTDLHYVWGDEEIILRKAVVPDDLPQDPFRCYWLQIILYSGDEMRIMRALLTAVNDEEIPLEGGGTAHLRMNPQGGE